MRNLCDAVPIGLWQAVRRNRAVDYTFTGLSFLFYAAPTFFVGTVLIYVFSVKLHWLGAEGPQGGVVSDFTD
jgi:peptide/nickel transport system permease protein